MTTTTPPDIDAARAALQAALTESGISYYRAMVRYAWQMNWNSRREAMPPPMETLTAEQLFHLTCLIRDNHTPAPVTERIKGSVIAEALADAERHCFEEG